MKKSYFQYISKKNRLILYKLLADLIDDGIPLYDALIMLKDKDGELVYGKLFVKKLSMIIENMKNSSSVTESLMSLIPEQEIMVIHAAETSGQLPDGLRMLVSMTEKSNEISSSIKKSLLTPILLFIVVLFVIMGYSLQVFPTFLNVLPLSQWPGVTQGLYNFGMYLSDGGLFTIFLFFITLMIVVMISMPLLKGTIRTKFLDKIPPYNYYLDIQQGLFLRMLSTLMLNNVPIADAIELIESRSSKWLSSHLTLFYFNMKEGKSYQDALDTGFLNKEMLLIIKIYSGLDSFAITVKKMADNIECKIVDDIKKLNAILKNIALIGLASSVIWIFSAIFSLVDKLGAGF
ncbi:type II secretion system F family protein [Vibrio cholerae]|uniref:type II secretion system F family protein n=1 Tax=Vibrio cholerae TaxID=666 RepID=UPI000BA8EF48|nr:type II secretion system F family protein [Vibrio cholerae]PAR92343.1 conjugal transfer protein [Vibrio cholerae]